MWTGNGRRKIDGEEAENGGGKDGDDERGLEKDSRAILKLFVDASSESNSKNSNSINGSSNNGDIYLRLRENLGDDFPEQLSHVELSVALCDDAYIQALNKEWRSKDAPTDVLSFPNGGEEEGIAAFGPICVLGDIIISIETANASKRGWTFRGGRVEGIAHARVRAFAWVRSRTRGKEREGHERARTRNHGGFRVGLYQRWWFNRPSFIFFVRGKQKSSRGGFGRHAIE